jgi:Tfp pilus assembly protein PilP
MLLAVLAAALFTGCGESAKAPGPPSPVAPKPIQPITQGTATVAEVTSQPIYTYNPAGRRDPFSPLIVKEEAKVKLGARPPLERYAISEFKLTGIVWGGFGYNAMLEGPEGKGYFVRVGTIIGPNRGVIKKITKDVMVIEEKYKTSLGATERKEIVVELRKKQEGTQ